MINSEDRPFETAQMTGHPESQRLCHPTDRTGAMGCATRLICCRFTGRINGCLLLAFSWLMRRAYPALLRFQELIEMILEGFFTASNGAKSAAPSKSKSKQSKST
jgi:hypothetical protein